MIISKIVASFGILGVLFITSANAATLRPGEWQMYVQMPGMPKATQENISAHPVLMCVHPGETALKTFMYYTNYGCDFSKSGAQGSGFSGTIACYRGSHTFREHVSETIATDGKSFVAQIHLIHVPDNNPVMMKLMGHSIYRGKWVRSICMGAIVH